MGRGCIRERTENGVACGCLHAGSLAVWQHEVERLQRALQAAESQRRLAEERAAEAEAQLHATRSAHAALDRQMRAHTGLDTPHTPGHLHTLRTQVRIPLCIFLWTLVPRSRHVKTLLHSVRPIA